MRFNKFSLIIIVLLAVFASPVFAYEIGEGVSGDTVVAFNTAYNAEFGEAIGLVEFWCNRERTDGAWAQEFCSGEMDNPHHRFLLMFNPDSAKCYIGRDGFGKTIRDHQTWFKIGVLIENQRSTGSSSSEQKCQYGTIQWWTDVIMVYDADGHVLTPRPVLIESGSETDIFDYSGRDLYGCTPEYFNRIAGYYNLQFREKNGEFVPGLDRFDFWVEDSEDATFVSPDQDPFPVELVNFSIFVVGKRVELTWVTISESNNYGFQIQRSADQKVWQEIGFVKAFGTGTTATPQSYEFVDKPKKAGIYFYRLCQIDGDGVETFSDDILRVSIGMDSEIKLANYPNPCNPMTTISFSLPKAGKTTLAIYDILGQRVRLFADRLMSAGVHQIHWDGTNENRKSVSSGIYFVRLDAGGIAVNHRISVLK